MTKLSSLLDQIDSGVMLLPEFQRGYVWNRDQVRGLMRSLYRGYPVGALLIWETEPLASSVRGDVIGSPGVKQLLLDGQQRVTTLYGVARGKPPAFFEGDATAFTGLRFNLETEVFEFYSPSKMSDDPHWIDVTELFKDGLQPHITRLSADPSTSPRLATYLTRLSQLQGILDRDFHAEKITGSTMTIDHVVDIFNKVNSGGTKLSKGDLALAKVCADWPEARTTLRAHLADWERAGYSFSLDWLLRNVNAVATGRAPFEALDGVTTDRFSEALSRSTGYVGGFLDLVAGRLGLDHDRVLLGRYAIPVATRIQHLTGGLGDRVAQDRLLYWYINAGLWGRFTGSTETVLARDYDTVQRSGIDGLIEDLRQWRGGNLHVGPHDFHAFGKGSRFYPLLYLMTRVLGARDLGTGIELKRAMLGHLSSLQVHHIFPKTKLYEAGYGRGDVNSVANFCFLTQQTNLDITNRRPSDYLAEIEERHPGALASQWIPTDPALWEIDAYPAFLSARRILLAEAANEFLDGLLASGLPTDGTPLPRFAVADAADDEDELGAVRRLRDDAIGMGLTPAAMDVEIVDPRTGRAVAVAELFWEHGLQSGQGAPVVLDIDPDPAGLAVMEELGYDVFTSVDALRAYLRNRSQEASGEREMTEDVIDEDGAADSGGDPHDDAAPPDPDEVRAAFARAIRELYARTVKETDHRPSYFLDMLQRYGAVETAHRLLAAPTASAGFLALAERARLDLTVEWVANLPEFADLFSDEERETARQRLDDAAMPSGL